MRPAWWRPCQLHVGAEGEFLSCRSMALSWKAAAVKLENQRLREEIRQAVEVAEVSDFAAKVVASKDLVQCIE